MSNPITDQELDELGELLFKYGNDDAILDVSELDGFVNALCSSPHMLPPSEWLPEVSGGKLPRFKSKAQAQRYTDLIIKFYNTVAIMLSEATDELNLFFEVRDTAQGEIVVLEEWCFGYMRGCSFGTMDRITCPSSKISRRYCLARFGGKFFRPGQDEPRRTPSHCVVGGRCCACSLPLPTAAAIGLISLI